MDCVTYAKIIMGNCNKTAVIHSTKDDRDISLCEKEIKSTLNLGKREREFQGELKKRFNNIILKTESRQGSKVDYNRDCIVDMIYTPWDVKEYATMDKMLFLKFSNGARLATTYNKKRLAVNLRVYNNINNFELINEGQLAVFFYVWRNTAGMKLLDYKHCIVNKISSVLFSEENIREYIRCILTDNEYDYVEANDMTHDWKFDNYFIEK
ncbi:ORF101 [Ostreid herpesvirus 1]|uniref:Uncharacterized protein ORF101 n=2 Tax=root TaxID=1 RepID=Y101_OSHVF|nr:ORF101 [Ostreid herpesvirus 1]Q6R7C8.1 RecName: Full=Uncharacterized protein ORF101 [Ostreid herpesvirus 1 (isolate France)]AAS00987.1 ORF101 [Ostreid herpesvirus 1]ASK05624.1 ORF101 [Ostreid herpesvirus 1]ASK05755.1 ORF101 [Ostreid herpesvirus 1]AVL27027.1 ORF101 [Ostreid herpesvirus 1]UPX73080.1 ORF101 [Ostreid herpesvirus 1]